MGNSGNHCPWLQWIYAPSKVITANWVTSYIIYFNWMSLISFFFPVKLFYSFFVLLMMFFPIYINRNPLYLMAFFVIYLVSRALWVQMDIPGQFRHGTVSKTLNPVPFFLGKYSVCFSLACLSWLLLWAWVITWHNFCTWKHITLKWIYMSCVKFKYFEDFLSLYFREIS